MKAPSVFKKPSFIHAAVKIELIIIMNEYVNGLSEIAKISEDYADYRMRVKKSFKASMAKIDKLLARTVKETA